jgi:hypothetical protein
MQMYRTRRPSGHEGTGHRGGAVGSRLALLAVLLLGASGCAAAIGAALAAGDIRRGVAGAQDLIAGARSLGEDAAVMDFALSSPLVGTYRGFQALGPDTVRFFARTMEEPSNPIVDEGGRVTGYVLAALSATSLDTLESRVREWSAADGTEVEGRALFFVEGTTAPDPNARTLYPAAFLGRVAAGESREADRLYAELAGLDIEMEAPRFRALAGQGIPHELFGSVAEGIFTLRPDGQAVFHQEYETEDGRTLTLHFERISGTTLPARP